MWGQSKTHLNRGSCALGNPVDKTCDRMCYLMSPTSGLPEQLTSEFEEHRAAPHSHSWLVRTRQDSHRSAGRVWCHTPPIFTAPPQAHPPLVLSTGKDESAVGVLPSFPSSIYVASCRPRVKGDTLERLHRSHITHLDELASRLQAGPMVTSSRIEYETSTVFLCIQIRGNLRQY